MTETLHTTQPTFTRKNTLSPSTIVEENSPYTSGLSALTTSTVFTTSQTLNTKTQPFQIIVYIILSLIFIMLCIILTIVIVLFKNKITIECPYNLQPIYRRSWSINTETTEIV